jgi:hypothetical protein
VFPQFSPARSLQLQLNTLQVLVNMRRVSYYATAASCHLQRRRLLKSSSLSCHLSGAKLDDTLFSSRSLATSATALRLMMPSTKTQCVLLADAYSSSVCLQPRLFSTMAASSSNVTSEKSAGNSNSNSSNSNSSTDNNKKEKKRDDDSNIFLDNLGKIFLSSLGIVLLMLFRSTKSSNSRIALRDEMENEALLDPLEIDDLRRANTEFTIDVWNTIVEHVKDEFIARGVSSVTYPQFLSLVMSVMKEMKGEGFTIQMGHLVDRVVIAELERRRRDDKNNNLDEVINVNQESDELPLSFLLASLSLALNSTVADRIRVLYECMLLLDTDGGGGEESNTSSSGNNNYNNLVSEVQVESMIQNLQSTCQLVADAQIVETNSKVPYQTFRVGTGKELIRRAREGYGGKKGQAGVTREVEGPITMEDFHAILKSRTVCAWGECYIKKNSRTSTSDL